MVLSTFQGVSYDFVHFSGSLLWFCLLFRKSLMVLSNFQEVSFIVVCDVTAEPRELVKHLEDSQVDIKDAVNFSDMLNICSLDNILCEIKGKTEKIAVLPILVHPGSILI